MRGLKKIYYFPGLISAIIIPLLFWYYGSRKFEEINLNVIDIGLPPKIRPGEKVNESATFESVRNWNYKKIIVEPNSARENSKRYISDIKQLQKENRKESGIEFILNDENTYDDIISLLNDIESSGQLSYCLDLNKTGHFFVPHQYIDPTITKIDDEHIFRCGTGLVMQSDLKNNSSQQFSEFETSISQLPKPSFYFIFGFLLFLNISMFSIKDTVQFNKRQ
ncbi:hypothetical protein PFY10_20575 [Chryseobacterium daecheongense]|nr:hypothetical protein PFY10_20575 [Chryseobacterium daecheongense]